MTADFSKELMKYSLFNNTNNDIEDYQLNHSQKEQYKNYFKESENKKSHLQYYQNINHMNKIKNKNSKNYIHRSLHGHFKQTQEINKNWCNKNLSGYPVEILHKKPIQRRLSIHIDRDSNQIININGNINQKKLYTHIRSNLPKISEEKINLVLNKGQFLSYLNEIYS